MDEEDVVDRVLDRSILTLSLCYHCGVRGHLARDCPQTVQSKTSGKVVPSHGNLSRSGQKGSRGRVRGRSVRF